MDALTRETDKFYRWWILNFKENKTMAKHGSNPNSKENSYPYPRDINSAAIRKQIDPDLGARERHEADIAKLDRGQGAEKGGR